MIRITKSLDNLEQLPAVFNEARERLHFHTESGFTAEEAHGYAQQLDDVEQILVPDWKQRLEGQDYRVQVDCSPKLGGFIKVSVQRPDTQPVVVFTEAYNHFNAEMCDGSCYQYVYQKVLCFQEGLQTGRVPL